MGRAVRRLGAIVNLVHGFVYFVTEGAEEYERIGLTTFRTQYFGSRAAPMGPVGPEIVLATFFNFSIEAVSEGVPAAWESASPEAIQQARFAVVGRVLERVGGVVEPAALAEATEIVSAMAADSSMAGRPLAAANAAVELPDDPLTRLWQLLTVVREYRGDAHVAALTTAPLTPVEALVLHAGTGLIDRARMQETRSWPDAAWDGAIADLSGRGLLDLDGALTADGVAFRESIEDRTDRATQPMLDVVGDDRVHRLCDLIEPLRDALIADVAYPWPRVK